jgi:acyl-CoA thioester hydrolase
MNKTPGSVYKIRFSDCDMFGHLNNSRYLDYMINAREDHLKDYYGFNLDEHYRNALGWVIGSHEIAYLRPAVYNEIVYIQSSLLSVGEELFHVETLMMNEKQDNLKAILRTKLIPVDTKTGRKRQHPADILDWAAKLVNDSINEQTSLQERTRELLNSYKTMRTPQ